jgi:hypothetical protein
MASSEITIRVSELPEVRAVVEAAMAVVEARNAGAECYEAKAEIDGLEAALGALAAWAEIPHMEGDGVV